MKRINKIIVNSSIQYYSKAWTQRNEIIYKPKVHKNYVINQHKNIKNLIEKGNKPEMIRYLRIYDIDVENCSNSYIRKWNMDALEMHKKTRTEVLRDIHTYFQRS